MEENANIILGRKNKIEKFFFSWVKDNYDKLFLVVLGVAFIIRLWIFFKTYNQPLWWDEADYLSAAKNIGLGLDIQDIWYYRRGFLFSLIAAPFFTLGFGEFGLRFLEVLFSTGFIFVSYLLISKMFDKKLALYSSIGLTFSWILLFFTGRVMTDIPAAFFILLSFLFLWKGYVLREGNKFIYISGAIFALAVLTRMQSLMMVPAFMVPIFLKEKFRMFSNRKIWLGALVFLLVLSPQIYLYSQHYGNPVSDISSYYLKIGEETSVWETGLGVFSYLKNIPYMMNLWIFSLFFLGLFFFFTDLVLGFDKIFSSEKVQNKFIVFFWIISLFLVMGYLAVDYVEQRYITAALPFLFLIAISPLIKAEEFLEKNLNNKQFSKIITVFALFLLLIPNIMLAKNLLEQKENSYSEVRGAALWIKENSSPLDSVISSSVPQITYYSERSTYPYDPGFFLGTKLGNKDFLKYSDDYEGFLKFIEGKKPRYLIFSIFEANPDWFAQYVQSSSNLVPVKVYKQGEQSVLVIYEFNYNDSVLSPINL